MRCAAALPKPNGIGGLGMGQEFFSRSVVTPPTPINALFPFLGLVYAIVSGLIAILPIQTTAERMSTVLEQFGCFVRATECEQSGLLLGGARIALLDCACPRARARFFKRSAKVSKC